MTNGERAENTIRAMIDSPVRFHRGDIYYLGNLNGVHLVWDPFTVAVWVAHEGETPDKPLKWLRGIPIEQIIKDAQR